MIPAIRAEFRKLLTVRSTYFTVLIALALVIFISFYVKGYKANGVDVHDASALTGVVTTSINAVGIFGGLVSLLLLAHEYRYNTIVYTLTASARRLKVLLAKTVAVSVFALTFAAMVGIVAGASFLLGAHMKDIGLTHQTLQLGDVMWRVLYVGWGMSMLALVLIALIRNQVAGVAALFIIPGTIEGLLSIWLKNNAAYLPFTALSDVAGIGTISHVRALVVSAGYIVVGWIVAAILFVQRDAS